jgi:hypothetical protein
MANEKRLGFSVSDGTSLSTQVSCISGILKNTQDEKNYFIKTSTEGTDAIDNSETSSWVIALGNGFISSYSTTAAVGGFPTSDVTIEALNMIAVNGTSGKYIPAVNPTDGTVITGYFYQIPTGTTSVSNTAIGTAAGNQLSVLRPGDITFNLGLDSITDGSAGMFLESDLKVQNYTLSFNLTREDLNKLGSKYAYAKTITFPVQATMSVTAMVGEFQTGDLVKIVDSNTTFSPRVSLKLPGSSTIVADFQLKGAKLDNQDISSSIGPNKSVTMNFVSQIGSSEDTSIGLFMSGTTQ